MVSNDMAETYISDIQLAARFGVHRATPWRWAKCSIPEHCIDPRRLPLFIARSALGDLIAGLQAYAKGVQAV